MFDDIYRVGVELGAGGGAVALLNSLRERRNRIASRTATIADSDRPRVAFLEWLLPPFNGGHWNPELVTLAGGIDLLARMANRRQHNAGPGSSRSNRRSCSSPAAVLRLTVRWTTSGP